MAFIVVSALVLIPKFNTESEYQIQNTDINHIYGFGQIYVTSSVESTNFLNEAFKSDNVQIKNIKSKFEKNPEYFYLKSFN